VALQAHRGIDRPARAARPSSLVGGEPAGGGDGRASAGRHQHGPDEAARL